MLLQEIRSLGGWLCSFRSRRRPCETRAEVKPYASFWYVRSATHVFGPVFGRFTDVRSIGSTEEDVRKVIEENRYPLFFPFDVESALDTLRGLGQDGVRAVFVRVDDEGMMVEEDPHSDNGLLDTEWRLHNASLVYIYKGRDPRAGYQHLLVMKGEKNRFVYVANFPSASWTRKTED